MTTLANTAFIQSLVDGAAYKHSGIHGAFRITAVTWQSLGLLPVSGINPPDKSIVTLVMIPVKGEHLGAGFAFFEKNVRVLYNSD
jgi:hypothetical protein